MQNVDEYPYSAIGLIRAKYVEEETVFFGTGCLIGHNLVLTSFHNFIPNGRSKSEIEIDLVPSPIHKRGGRGFNASIKY